MDLQAGKLDGTIGAPFGDWTDQNVLPHTSTLNEREQRGSVGPV